jgi:IS4 transposase
LIRQAKEFSMNPSNMGPVPESPREKDRIADSVVLRPMSQQDAGDTHGHEMHMQKFVRLIGCHEENAARHEAAGRLH